jgi:hypothetical protein
LTKTYGTEPALWRGVSQAVDSLPAVRRIKRRPLEPKLRDTVARELEMAWNKESSIRTLSEIDPTRLPSLLPNAAVNSYYAIYHGARAWIAASGQPPPDTHTKVLHALADAAAERLLFPPPWDLVCIGYPKAGEADFPGLPDDLLLGPLHGWRLAHSDETLHTSLCTLLRTTRARTFKKRKADWRKRNKKAGVPATIAHKLAETLPPTTFFEFLWRLRVRSDYHDIAALIPGRRQTYHAVDIQQALTTIVSATLALFEALIAHASGPEVVGDAERAFVERVGTAGGAAVSQRVAQV